MEEELLKEKKRKLGMTEKSLEPLQERLELKKKKIDLLERIARSMESIEAMRKDEMYCKYIIKK